MRAQDLEAAPDGGTRIRQGVAPDRRISVHDSEMRTGGRAAEALRWLQGAHRARPGLPGDVACAVTPANRPEELGAMPIAQDIEREKLRLVELHIDAPTSTAPSSTTSSPRAAPCSPSRAERAHRLGLFTKGDFKIDLRAKTITCPAGEVEPFEPGDTVEFDPEACGACRLRAKCTQAASGSGRTVSSPATKPGNASTESSSRLDQAAPHYAAALPSNTPSPTSPPEGTSRSLCRRETQSVRPATFRRHPEPREYPSPRPCCVTTGNGSGDLANWQPGRARPMALLGKASSPEQERNARAKACPTT